MKYIKINDYLKVNYENKNISYAYFDEDTDLAKLKEEDFYTYNFGDYVAIDTKSKKRFKGFIADINERDKTIVLIDYDKSNKSTPSDIVYTSTNIIYLENIDDMCLLED